MRIWRVVFVLVIISTSATAQTAKQTESKTKLESFEAKTGTVIVSGFTTAGEVRGGLRGGVTVEAVEFTDATSGTKMSGIRIEVSQGDDIGTQSISFVDADEIDSLLKGIDYISKVDKSATKMNDFQADYKTRGDLTITTFSQSNGKIGTAIQSGNIGAARVFLKSDGLLNLRSLVVQAQSQIEGSR